MYDCFRPVCTRIWLPLRNEAADPHLAWITQPVVLVAIHAFYDTRRPNYVVSDHTIHFVELADQIIQAGI